MPDEILTTQAIIRAAELQAEATVFAGLIGAVAIVCGLILSWRTALHLQRVSRLAETKRDVYLDLVQAYSEMITGFQMLGSEIEKNWISQKVLILNFSKMVDKVSFICETETKNEIFNFLELFKEKYLVVENQIEPILKVSEELGSLVSQHKIIMERFDNAARVLETIKIENRNPDKIENILKYFDEKLLEADRCLPLLTQKEIEFNSMRKPAHDLITSFVHDLGDMVLPITRRLRKELGAKTNIILDDKLHLRIRDM